MLQTKPNKSFYAMALALAVPLMLQNGITNFVSLLDNLMVGQLSTEQMSGVSIANQLIFVFNLLIFGATSGAGIFTAQFYGKGDVDGIRNSMRYKIVLCAIIATISISLFWFFGKDLISLFLYESDQTGDLTFALEQGNLYLRTALIGMIPFTLSQCYSSTLRETGDAKLPLVAGLIAVAVNMSLNYVLIFGKLGAPALGVAGAAVATAAARVTELCVVAIGAHRNGKNTYLESLFSRVSLPSPRQVWSMTTRAVPLMVNEGLWAAGTTFLAQCYATRGLAVVAAFNIHTTTYNVLSTAFLAMGIAIGIILGNLLGADKMDEALVASRKLTIFSIAVSGIFIVVQIGLAFLVPNFYNTTQEVKDMAFTFMLIGAGYMPIHCYINGAYFTLRSGGCTGITFIYDCVFIFFVTVPLAYFLSRYTNISGPLLFALVLGSDFFKCIVGHFLVKSRRWMRNITQA